MKLLAPSSVDMAAKSARCGMLYGLTMPMLSLQPLQTLLILYTLQFTAACSLKSAWRVHGFPNPPPLPLYDACSLLFLVSAVTSQACPNDCHLQVL